MAFIPNTTPTPNWLYNGEMKKMNETELKVVLLVTRKTLGWFDPMTQERKQQDNISQSQFMEFTGKSHTAIAGAIQSSVNHGWIIAKDKTGNLCNTSEKRKRRRIWYQLGNIFTNKISKQQSGQDENLSNILEVSKQQSGLNLSNKVDNTKEKKVTNTNIVANAPIEDFSFLKELETLKAGTRKDFKIIALYWKKKNFVFTNKKQFETALKRELRSAKDLCGYTGEQIARIMKYCEEKYPDMWTLETCIKRSAEVVNKNL